MICHISVIMLGNPYVPMHNRHGASPPCVHFRIYPYLRHLIPPARLLWFPLALHPLKSLMLPTTQKTIGLMVLKVTIY